MAERIPLTGGLVLVAYESTGDEIAVEDAQGVRLFYYNNGEFETSGRRSPPAVLAAFMAGAWLYADDRTRAMMGAAATAFADREEGT